MIFLFLQTPAAAASVCAGHRQGQRAGETAGGRVPGSAAVTQPGPGKGPQQ